jgi:magnesium-transporting ATPase (P-type)
MHDNNTSNRKGILVITKGAVEVLLDKIDEHQKPPAFERKANEVANEGYLLLCHKRNASVVGPLK